MPSPPSAEKIKNRIHLTTPRTPWGDDEAFADQLARCHAVDGASWSASRKVWTYPLDWITCLHLRKIWGPDLEVGPQLWEWAEREKARRHQARTIAAQSGFDLAKVAARFPELAEAMSARNYQTVGATFLKHAHAALLADQPGLGKTLQAMAAVVESDVPGPVLVLAPTAAVELTWPDEVEKWLPGESAFVCSGTRDRRQTLLDRFARRTDSPWLLANPEMLEVPHPSSSGKMRDVSYPDLWRIPWAHIIVDEAHDYLIAHAAQPHKQSYVRQGIGRLSPAGGLRIALSGTPFRGKQHNLWGTLNWLRPDLYTSYWTWVGRWFETYEDNTDHNKIIIGKLRSTREKAFHRELDTIVLRRTKAEVAPDLPPKQYAGRRLPGQVQGTRGIWLEMLPEQRRAYDQMRRHAAAELEGGTLLANGVLAEYLRLRQFATSCGKLDKAGNFTPKAPSNKISWTLHWLSERDYSAGVVIASQFSSIIDLTEWHLNRAGHDTLKITGDVAKKSRRFAKDRFQSGEGPRIMLLTTTAGGVSLTLDAADDMILFDETWIPDEQEQLEDRIHRVSRIHRTTYWYLRSLGTIEHVIATRNIAVDKANKWLLDGRRGARNLHRIVDYHDMLGADLLHRPERA